MIYDNILKYFLGNNLISPKQSTFRLGDSCVNQLLPITHDIFTFFDSSVEGRGVFLEIFKAFDKLWHDGFIEKLKQNGIKDKLLCLLIDFLKKMPTKSSFKWSVLIMDKRKFRRSTGINFLIYINDLANGLHSNPKLFADDTS